MLRLANGGRTWWAHLQFTRINITPTILPKKIEERPDIQASKRFLATINARADRQTTAAFSGVATTLRKSHGV
jgi:hypothetical protein